MSTVGQCGTPTQKSDWVGGQRTAEAYSNATVLALDSTGQLLAQHTVLAADGAASGWRVSLLVDVPFSIFNSRSLIMGLFSFG